MESDYAAFFAGLDSTPPHRAVSGYLAVRVRPRAAGQPPRVVHLRCDGNGFHVMRLRPMVCPDAFVDVGEADLQSLFHGEDEMQDLLMTRRIWVSGHAALGHACCQAMSDVLTRGQGDGRLRPFPGVSVTADFTVIPFDVLQPRSLPIVITAFNRVRCLRALVHRLRRDGYENLYVVDNASDYQPLIDFYRAERLRVFRLDRNVGCYALWRTPIWAQILHTPYALTDPDVLPLDECPCDYVARFLTVLGANPDVEKVGFGLKIDDIPDSLSYKNEILRHEQNFWTQPLGPDLFVAPIDTTFAVYRAGARGGVWARALRTAAPYLARHTPWYDDELTLTPEDEHYHRTSRRATFWTARAADYPFQVARASRRPPRSR